MIEIEMRLIPHGDRDKAVVIATGSITLIGGNEQTGNYRVVLGRPNEPRSMWRTGSIHGFPRQRLGPWHLLQRCLGVILAMERSGQARPPGVEQR